MAEDTYLDAILDHHREEALSDRRSVDDLFDQAVALPPPRRFAEALVRAPNELAIIAEIKRASPRGDIDLTLDPTSVAAEYESGGAACLSVLTDRTYFNAKPDDLPKAKAGCTLPILRKDFIVSEQEVCAARIMGADAILLIVAALNDVELKSLSELARQLGMDVLVEAHDIDELRRALDLQTGLVGVNQRNLKTFAVDSGRAASMVSEIPDSVVAVAESGIGGPQDARRLADAGFQAVLVGEYLIRRTDRGAAVSSLKSKIARRGVNTT